ncbi:MAG: RelA/SpoT domain-containing protein [Burkholderiales bacterium]|nr:RelA/SpoT domain-containing protein [Burkholderiales bacterium]
MNLDDYENEYFLTYEAFAETIRFVLEKALLASDNLPMPQSIQCRAKSVESLRRRLSEIGRMDTQALEHDRRDLAGARLIFYTNNDVDRFLASSLIHENFVIEEGSTKIHHPTPENNAKQYRAIHYTVKLREDRTRLPEYARFAGLRCEIQVQTLLDHAWSETSHDILYKNELAGKGYGGRAMKSIERRFEKIMDEYLIPAGYEMQKAQQEYERLIQGKELFDKGIVELLDNARNNNERYEILSGLRDSAIPNYDDLPAAYKELRAPLLRTAKAARVTEPVQIETTFGKMEGFRPDAVTRLVVEIVESLRYVDVVGTLQLLIDIYRDEPNEDIREQIVKAVQNLSQYNIDAYKQVGPMLQMVLVDHLVGMSDAEVNRIWPIALTIWTEAIQSRITSTKWKADTVTLTTGVLPASDQIREVRDKAIDALFAAYDRSADDTQKRDILSALDVATRTPNQGRYSNELLATTIKDATRIVEFVTECADAESYGLLQHLEHRFFFYYRRAIDLVDDPENKFCCQIEAGALMSTIIKFRDTINADDRFIKYKVLVGFESVYPRHWTELAFDYMGDDEYRHQEAERYIGEINGENENEWIELISRCAETKSNDLATFPVFGSFISKLGERRPDLAERLLSKASIELRHFLAGFLNGMALSSRRDIYERNLEHELGSVGSLPGIARHLRYSTVANPDLAARLLKEAIQQDDCLTVIECLLFALEQYGTEKIKDSDTFVRDALTFLNDHKNARWVAEAWFLQKATRFYDELTPERAAQILQNMGYLPKVDYQVEIVLMQLAKRDPEAIWDYFGSRIAREVADGENQEKFEAVPFQFHELQKELSKDPQLAIRKGLPWFDQDRILFQYRGGRLLSSAFPNCTPEFATALAELVKAGGDKGAEFALTILQNYQGELPTHVVLKEIVAHFPDDISKMSRVRIAIDNTGVVSGEFGFAEAWRTRKESMTEWLADGRSAVKAFAEKHTVELDRKIASEQRRAEAEKEMRKRSYGEDGDSVND